MNYIIRNCSGRTSKGQPCKNKTRDIDGFCVKHKPRIIEEAAIADEPIAIADEPIAIATPVPIENIRNEVKIEVEFEEKEPDDIEEIRRQIYMLEHPNEPPPPITPKEPLQPKVKSNPILLKPKKLEIEQVKPNPNILKQTEDDIFILGLSTTCRCCFDEEVKNEDLIRCSNATASNKHLVCKMCLENYVKSMLETATATLACMFHTADSAIDNCNGCYTETDFKNVLDEDKFKIFTDCREMQEVSKMAGIIDNFQICPNCSKFGCAVEVPKGVSHIYVKCQNCAVSWCSDCRRNAHGDKHCYNLIFKPDETLRDKVSYIDKMINEISTSKLTHSCVACGTKFYKEEGCNHMTCPKCKTHSCYLCNAKLPPADVYKHFGNPGGCTLHNERHKNGKSGNVVYNNTRIFVELDKFIEVNDRCIHQMILGRIKMYYKFDTKIDNITKRKPVQTAQPRVSNKKIDPYLDGIERTMMMNRIENKETNGLNADAEERIKILQKKYNLI